MNDIDEIHRDLTYSGPIIATNFAGNVKAIKSFFIQNSEMVEGQEIKVNFSLNL